MTGGICLSTVWLVDDVDKSVHKPLPVVVTVHRKQGAVRIYWTSAPDDVFLQVFRPLVNIGEAVLAWEDKKRPEAGGAAPGQCKSSEKDS